MQAMTAWNGTPPRVLPVERPEAAVALGAAYYGHLRALPDGMRRVLIRAGSPRSYYLGVQGPEAGETELAAVAVLPRGVQEGTEVDLASRVFTVLTNRAVSFPLYSSLVRVDRAGDAVVLDAERDDLHRHAPLVSVLRFGKRSRQAEIPVHLTARFTELGTLELWLQSADTDHRWRLQFQLRGAAPHEEPSSAGPSGRDEVLVADEVIVRAEQLLDGCVRRAGAGWGDTGNGGRRNRDARRVRQAGLAGAGAAAAWRSRCCGCRTHAAVATASRRDGSTWRGSACAPGLAPRPTSGASAKSARCTRRVWLFRKTSSARSSG